MQLFVSITLLLLLLTRSVVAMNITSTAFDHNGKIPNQYSCHGKSISPPLAWNEVPANAKSLVLILDDPDAPKATFTHWILYNIPPTVKNLEEAITELPAGTELGLNTMKETKYVAPCPPSGHHHYHFKLYALDKTLSFEKPPTSKILQESMQPHILATSELIGVYP
jgi:Raf kinase inhibitor-like YbhB/YbcL family protein